MVICGRMIAVACMYVAVNSRNKQNLWKQCMQFFTKRKMEDCKHKIKNKISNFL